MPDLCRVQGRVISPEHEVLPGALVEFTLSPSRVQPSRDGVSTLVPKLVSAVADATGVVSVMLEPAVYRVTIYSADLHKFSPVRISVPDADEADLADIQADLPIEPVFLNEVRRAVQTTAAALARAEEILEDAPTYAALLEQIAALEAEAASQREMIEAILAGGQLLLPPAVDGGALEVL